MTRIPADGPHWSRHVLAASRAPTPTFLRPFRAATCDTSGLASRMSSKAGAQAAVSPVTAFDEKPRGRWSLVSCGSGWVPWAHSVKAYKVVSAENSESARFLLRFYAPVWQARKTSPGAIIVHSGSLGGSRGVILQTGSASALHRESCIQCTAKANVAHGGRGGWGSMEQECCPVEGEQPVWT